MRREWRGLVGALYGFGQVVQPCSGSVSGLKAWCMAQEFTFLTSSQDDAKDSVLETLEGPLICIFPLLKAWSPLMIIYKRIYIDQLVNLAIVGRAWTLETGS